MGLCKHDYLTSGVTVDHMEIVCNVATENRNIANCYIDKNAELPLDRDPISVVTNESKPGLDDLTVNVSADSTKFKVLGGSQRRKQGE